jgi:hypothetical protein
MAVKEIIGYALAGVGILSIIASSDKVKALIPLIKNIPTIYLVIAGGVLVLAGVVMIGLGSSSRVKQAKEEVPIYEGEGRNRKIVGYQRVK